MRGLLIVAISLLLGCGAPEAANAPDAPTNLPNEVRDPLPALQWLGGAEADGEAWLYFGPDESDNINLHFACTLGAGFVNAEAFDPRAIGDRLALASGDVHAEFAATPLRDESGDFFGDAVKAHARISIDEPVISAFRRSGALTLGDPPEILRVATPTERERIDSFFEGCSAH